MKNAVKLVHIGIVFGIAVSSAFASQGVVLGPSQSLSFQIPNAPPLSTTLSTRVEFRMHAWTQPPSGTVNVISTPAFLVKLMAPGYNAPLAVTDWEDSFTEGQGNTLYLNIAGMTDIVVRVQRDTTARTLSATAWNSNGSGTPVTASLPIDGVAPLSYPSSGSIGDGGANCVMDYVRVFGTIVASTVSPFNPPTGSLMDWELDGNLNDSSAQNIGLTAQTAVIFAPSPAYAPFASQGPQRVLRAGVPQLLSALQSRSLNGGTALRYQWKQISGPTQLLFNSIYVATPVVTGLVFGSYQIQVTVIDNSGLSSSSTLKYGAVYTDSNDVVIQSPSYVTSIFGPMLRLGANPWPYFDASHQNLANFFGGLQSSDYLDVWNSAEPGTISVTNGSATVTGVGTSFVSRYCGGGTWGVNNATVVVWYPVPGTPGQFGRSPYTVASCQSDTALTLTTAFVDSSSAAGINYAYMNNNSIGTWINGSTNANYYDNVMAFYNLYYRSGIDDYLNYARTLADRWYSMPWFDGGRASNSGRTFIFPRLQSLTGIILRAEDGHPEYWSGIRQFANADYTFVNHAPTAGYALTDVREQAYGTAFVSLAALLDPIQSNRTVYLSELQTLLNTVWAPAVQTGGNWMNVSFGYASWNGQPGTVTVTNGSTTVLGTGTNWNQNMFSGNAVWTANSNGVTNGDAIAYTVTVVSPTQLTLNMPYQGVTTSGRGWESNNTVGVGSQPFMLGVLGQAFRFAYLASNDSRLPGYISGIANWLSTQGYRPDTRGLWYGRDFANCEPISPSNGWCSGGSVEASRFLAGEIVGAVSAAFQITGNTADQTFGDNIYGAMFGGPSGGPEADSTYVNDIAPNGWAIQDKVAKDFGFFFGFGGGPSWPAARLSPNQSAGSPRGR